jgi:hypothetical protein
VDELPVGLAGHRVNVALTQETDVAGLLQLIDGAGIVTVLDVVLPDGADVLVATVNGFDLTLAAKLLGNGRGRDAEDQQD